MLCVLIVAGCAGTQTGQSTQEPRSLAGPAKLSSNISALLIKAERSDDTKAAVLRIRAAQVSVDNGDVAQAKRILTLITRPFVTPESTIDYFVTRARISLAEESPPRALAFLNDKRLQALPLTQNHQIRIGRLRAEAYRQGRSYVASARERIYFDGLLDLNQRTANHESIFSVLLELPANSLVNHASKALTSDLRGWLSLAAMTKQYHNDPLRQLQELNNWKKIWSHHPAVAQLPASLQMLSRVVKEQPSAIALLLPMQGDLGSFGRAIRDGVLAAHYERGDNGRQKFTSIRIYDTSISDIGDLVNTAVADGAELIIGPLDRDKVSVLSSMKLTVPVVALNRTIGQQENPDLYQFGLAPEDEIIQVADQVRKEGYLKALAIVPEGEWGDRNLAVFRNRWNALGGIMVEEARFSDQRDYSDLVKGLLKVDQSERRSNELRRIIGKRFEFTPRRRQDIDFIFLLANPVQARGINPTLAFFYADDIPVYATSHVHEYSESRIDAIDLNGIRFCDIPWKLTSGDKIQKEIQKFWRSSQSSLAPFFALGIDAYRLYPRLSQLKEIPGERLFGATGILTLRNNTVVRNLMWAQFKNGSVITLPIVL
ncbi:MAG: penicillin-binding protein activator [Proteobacteria bacterium]|nr:penicillin-binding protein activator [Pseudomonadota bacterium]